jgi:hypothetical protein
MTIRGKWAVALLVVLALSLAGNVFVGGMAGGWVLFGQEEDEGRSRVDRWIDRIAQGLPKEAQEPVRAALEAHKSEIEERFAATHDARADLIELMRRPDLTREQLDQGFDGIGDAFRNAVQYTNDLVATAVLSVPPEVRAKWQAPPDKDGK